MDDPALDETRAEHFLRVASGEVRGYTGQTFDLVVDDEVLLAGNGSTVLLLPELPVLEVTELIEDPRDVATELVDETGFEWSPDGIIRRIDGGVFRRRFRWYAITYDHGFEATPEDVLGVVLRVAARGLENPLGLRSETIGRYSYTVSGENAGIGLYAPDRRELDPYVVPGGGNRPVNPPSS